MELLHRRLAHHPAPRSSRATAGDVRLVAIHLQMLHYLRVVVEEVVVRVLAEAASNQGAAGSLDGGLQVQQTGVDQG
jgi:hypothetical protein